MLTEKLKTTILEILAEECFKDEKQDLFYTAIYPDCNDELCDESILKICKAEKPRETFDEKITTMYEDYESELQTEILNKILEQDDIAAAVEAKEITVDDVREYLYEHHYTKIPYEHYLNQDICVDIILNTGDLNTDFTINQPFASWDGREDTVIDDDAAILWLARQQGYKKSALTRALRDKEYGESKFLKSMRTEVENVSTHMNGVVFMVQMSLKQWLELHDGIEKEKSLNDRYYPQQSKGRGFLLIDKSTTCGLYDPWQGAGGCLDIELEQDVTLPFRYIDSIYPDGGRGYSIFEIYGMCSSAWSSDGVKEIHAMKKAA